MKQGTVSLYDHEAFTENIFSEEQLCALTAEFP